MNKQDIISFFNALAPTWDSGTIKEKDKIKKIFDLGDISENCKVLDVACGTGVLISDYIDRKVKSITGIDISPAMIKIAKEKFSSFSDVSFVCGDIESAAFEEKFDRVMIYNAFPHFSNPENVIENIAGLLSSGGRLTVAHNMGIEELEKHHSTIKADVSKRLPEADEMEKLFQPYFETDVKISEKDIYIVSGVKKKQL
ncbi:MAG: class I SAM-dependent methyltransferase [Clostridia bacterium]|nr:class I SAM-dependent methyltransferase [Clostridia bacterium]